MNERGGIVLWKKRDGRLEKGGFARILDVKKKEYTCFSRVIFVYLRVERYKHYVEQIIEMSYGQYFWR